MALNVLRCEVAHRRMLHLNITPDYMYVLNITITRQEMFVYFNNNLTKISVTFTYDNILQCIRQIKIILGARVCNYSIAAPKAVLKHLSGEIHEVPMA